MTKIMTITLAAGKGTRMKSDLPKVLHKIAGLPMVNHVLNLAKSLNSSQDIVVIGHGGELVQQAVGDTVCVKQTEQFGTAHAVLQAQNYIGKFDGLVVILYGDTPLIQTATIQNMIEKVQKTAMPTIGVLGFYAKDAGGYGRLIIDGDGFLEAIVEAKEATPDQLKIDVCNSGVFVVPAQVLAEILPQIDNNNAKGEYYLTDLVSIARKRGVKTVVTICGEDEVLGVNSKVELAEAEMIFQRQKRTHFLLEGVTFLEPSTVYFSHDTVIASDAIIGQNVVFGEGVIIESGAEIRAFSHLENAIVKSKATVGPFARLRPGAVIGEKAHIGNFVEIKKSEIGVGSKVNHLSYIGDTEIHENVNVGAGTITCNYDGFKKHKTVIQSHAFIGSNTLLIAPVTVEEGAITGSGTVVTKTVPQDALAVTRPDMKIVDGWAKRFRDKNRDMKKSA